MNRKLGVQIIILLTLLSLFTQGLSYTVQAVPPITQDTIIVDISGTGDFTSIQDAIDNSNGGDTIVVRKGKYFEHNLRIYKMISIVGEDPANTIINCSGNSGFILNSPSVDIGNLKIVNTEDYAIYVPPGSSKCTISNIFIDRQKFKGIWIRASNTEVINCDIRGTGLSGTGIQLRESNSIILDCNIQGFTIGVLILVNSDDNKISNCNLLNNEEAVDIRIESDRNIVTECNIYANDQGVHIWQNSNKNNIYLNNFWKNEVDANAEGNNTWDKNSMGNYWDILKTVDANNDGIGDIPFTISEENVDRYPLTSMILPDEITLPTSVIHTSSEHDNTPSFTWGPSIYNKGVKGYYVKIDNNPERFIGDTLSWASPDSISDGVHTFYVRSEANDTTTSDYATITFSIDTIIIDSDGDGWSDEEEQQYGTDPNNDDNYPLDTDNDRTPDSFDIDDDNDGYSDSIETSYGTNTKNLNSYPIDTDKDGIPDDGSPDGKFTGDVDDDDDYLIDIIETQIGSNPLNGSDATRIYISGKPYYLVDTSQKGAFDILYEQTSGTITAVEKHDDNYLIDEDGDNIWDYEYNSADGSISIYKEEQLKLTLPVLILLIMVIILIISIFFLFYYYLKNKSMQIESLGKPEIVKKPTRIEVKDKIEMIDQTKDLLGCIQEDVNLYMKKLRELEDKIVTADMEIEEEKEEFISTEKDEDELDDIAEIEAEVDNFLSKKSKKTLSSLKTEKEKEKAVPTKVEEKSKLETIDEVEAEVEEFLSKEENVAVASLKTEKEEKETISAKEVNGDLDTITGFEADVDDLLSKLEKKDKKTNKTS